MIGDEYQVSTAAVVDDDLLLSALADGEAVADSGIEALLFAWRAELDSAIRPATSPTGIATVARRRIHHRAATAATVVALVTGGGVAAAAAGGPHGPLGGLHRILFGAADQPTHSTQQIRAELDEAGHRIAEARAAGFLTAAERTAITALLDRAAQQLSVEFPGSGLLRDRLLALQHRLAMLPAATASRTPVPPVASSAPRAPAPTRSETPPQPGAGGDEDTSGAPAQSNSEPSRGDESDDRSPRSESEQPSGDGGGSGSGSGGGADGGSGDGLDGGSDGTNSASGDRSGDGINSGSGAGVDGGSGDGMDGGSGDGMDGGSGDGG